MVCLPTPHLRLLQEGIHHSIQLINAFDGRHHDVVRSPHRPTNNGISREAVVILVVGASDNESKGELRPLT